MWSGNARKTSKYSPNKWASNSFLSHKLHEVSGEALTNVARHAKASRVEVTIESLDGSIRMAIADNGQGFEVDGKSSARKHNRLGLLGMRERVEMLGGTFGVESTPGHSTTVRVEIVPPIIRTKNDLLDHPPPTPPSP